MIKKLAVPVIGTRIERAFAVMLTAVFLLSSAMTGSYAWYHMESALNSFRGGSLTYSVVLEKYQRDIYGNETEMLIAGAVFDLYYIEAITSSPGVTEYAETLLEEGLRTDENGQIQISGLSPGEYYFLETSPASYYTYDSDAAGEAIRKYSFSIHEEQAADSDHVIRVKVYNQRLSGQLNITKKVENHDGSELTEEQLSQEFLFHVSFGEEGSYYYSLDGGEKLELTDGTLTLKHGQTAVFEELPAGLYYHVSEEPVSGYEIQSNDHQNQIPSIIDRPEGITAEFINIYDDSEIESVSLILSKTVTTEGGLLSEVDLEQEFAFRVQIGEEEHLITLKHGEEIVFDDIPIGTGWEAEELNTEQLEEAGYIALVSQMSGTILETENRVDFVNHKKAQAEAKSGDLLVSKAVIDLGQTSSDLDDDLNDVTDIDLNQEFTFRIQFSDGEDYRYLLNSEGELISTVAGSFTLKHGETALFPDIPEGVSWQVEEVSADGYTASVNRILGIIVPDLVSPAQFVNYRDDGADESGELLVSKTLAGETTEEDQNTVFAFGVQFGDDNSYPYYIDDTLYQMTAGKIYLKAGETARFFDLPARISYTVTEQEAEAYSASVSEVTGIIPAGGQANVDFVNYKEAIATERTGELVVSKEVMDVNAFEADSSDDSDEFGFSISFSDGNLYSYTMNGNEIYPEDGRFILKAGEQIRFTDIPEGVTYLVREEDYGESYIPGLIEQQGMIAADQTAYAAFTNARTEMTMLVIKKQIEIAGDDEAIDTEKQFYFTLTVNGEAEEFTLKHGEEKEFPIPTGAVYDLTEQVDEAYIQTSVINGYGTGESVVVEIIKTNTKLEEAIHPPVPEATVNISARKRWSNDGEEIRPESVQVQLYQDGQPFGSEVRLSEANSWKYTWNGLAEDHEWTVDEVAVPEDYEKTITGSVEAGYVITNTYRKEYPIDGGAGDTDPEDIDLGATEAQDESGSDGTGGSADESGAASASRSKAVRTGDPTAIWIWSLLLIASAIALRMIFWREDRKYEREGEGTR